MSQFNRFLWTGLVLGLAACGDDVTVTNPPEPPPPPTPGVTAVSVAPDGATINVGGTLGMTAAATLEPGAAAPTWAWSSSSTAATVAANGASATVTAVSAGSVGIRATATSGTSSASGVATVNIVAAAACAITGVTVNPTDAALVTNQTLQLAASVTGTNCAAADLAATWSVSPATGATISASGVFSATAAGAYVVRATSNKDGSKFGSSAITVTAAAPATVSIQSITQFATNVPVDLTNVGGQIEITLNVDPGAGTISKAQALINGIVVAEQVIQTPSAIAASPEAAPQTLVLSTNTRQVKKPGDLYVPVVFNGPGQITARVFVGANTTPTISNAVPVVMQNSDAVTAPTSFAATNATPVVSGWRKGTISVAGAQYIAFYPAGIDSLKWASNICGSTGNMTSGSPTLGYALAGTFSCTGASGSALPGAYTVWQTVPAPAADVIYIAASGLEQVGSMYMVDGVGRYNLLSNSPVFSAVKIDNVAPAITADVAYNPAFDQDWISATYAWTGAITGTDVGGVGYDASSEQAYLYDGGTVTSGTPPVTTPTCATSSALLANTHGLAQTLTDKLADAYQICAQAADSLGNSARVFSNKFGVDTQSPTAAIALSRGIDPVGAYLAPSVSANANTSKYGTLASVINQPWGLEAQDGRSGFNQFVVTGTDAAVQTLTRVWPGATVDAGNSACTLNDQLVTTLSDGWKRTILPANPADALDCGAGVGYYFYSGYVIDRAGNQSIPVGGSVAAPIVRNFVYDLAAPNMTGIGFSSTPYTAGSAGAFGFSANDDLNIVEGQVGFNYTGLPLPSVGILFPYNTGAVVLGPGFGIMWPTLRSQLANVLNGTTASAPIIFRIDETCEFNGNPYVNCDVGTYGAGSRPMYAPAVFGTTPDPALDPYNTNLSGGGQLTNALKLPNAVYANIRDVLSRESLTGAAGSFLATQFNPSTGASSPWGYSDVSTATYGRDIANWTAAVVGGNVVATHKTVTSNGLTVFQSAHLFRLNTVTNAWTHCAVMPNPTAPTIDNGSYRTWTYTIALPTLANPCNAGNGVTGPWKVFGLYNGAALATPQI